MTTTTQQALRVAREALKRISRWHGEFPSTGDKWPDGSPVSYGANKGSNGERDYMRQIALAALAASAEPAQVVAIPEGWQIVPKTITEEMHVAAVKMAQRCTGNDDFPRRVFQAMLSAAPALPQPSEQSELLQVAALLYSKWENGLDCYEDPDDCTGYIGKAFKLEDGEEEFCIRVLSAADPENKAHLAAPATEAQQEPNPWLDGAPSHPWDEEWFIAETTYGDRVVLIALPEEYTYDFKTADETYWRRDKIKKWMQFPDSEFVAPAVPSAAPEGWQKQIAHLKYRKRELETEVSDLRNTLAALKAAPVAQDERDYDPAPIYSYSTRGVVLMNADRMPPYSSAQPVAKQPTEQIIGYCDECCCLDGAHNGNCSRAKPTVQPTEQISDEEIIEAWEDEVANADELDVADAQIIAFARALLSHQAQPVAEKDAQDAKRYRWLKMESSPGAAYELLKTSWTKWDDAIDAAIASQGEKNA